MLVNCCCSKHAINILTTYRKDKRTAKTMTMKGHEDHVRGTKWVTGDKNRLMNSDVSDILHILVLTFICFVYRHDHWSFEPETYYYYH